MKVPARPERLPLLGFVFASLLSLSAVVMAADQPTTGAGPSSATQPSPGGALPDISGMAWMMDDLFVVVHDVKHHKSLQQPRVSLLRLPDGTAGIQLRNLAPAWPSAGGAAHDLESIARIPDSRELLLVESGDEGSEFRRIFHGRLNGERLQLVNALTWPLPVRNVEGSAVARVGERLIFLYAERAHDQATTSIRWADLTLDPLRLGRFQQVPFASPETRGPHSRPVSALEVDRQGNLICRQHRRQRRQQRTVSQQGLANRPHHRRERGPAAGDSRRRSPAPGDTRWAQGGSAGDPRNGRIQAGTVYWRG